MTSQDSDPAPADKRSLLGGIFRSWFLIYLVPVALVFGAWQYATQQAEAKRQREQEQQILNTLPNTDPAKMDPALRMLLGIDEGQPADPGSAAGEAATEDEKAAGEPEPDGPEVTPVADPESLATDAAPMAQDTPARDSDAD
jgi:hypothetical protein